MTSSSCCLDLAPLCCLPPRLFETPRLRLRAIEAGDSKLVFDLYASDPIATKYMSFKCTGQIEDTQNFVESAARYFLGQESPVKQFVWLIELKAAGEALGTAGLGPKDKYTLGGGYVLSRHFWGQGFASEAWTCLVEWGKTQPGVYRIEAWHDLDNPASGRVMQKAGMLFEGVLRRHSIHPNISDEPRDAAIYAWAKPNLA